MRDVLPGDLVLWHTQEEHQRPADSRLVSQQIGPQTLADFTRRKASRQLDGKCTDDLSCSNGAAARAYDIAVLVSNDSDLLGPVQLVSSRLQKMVGIINPQKHPAFVLKNAATFFKQIREGALAASQFPDEITDSIGTFHKPSKW